MNRERGIPNWNWIHLLYLRPRRSAVVSKYTDPQKCVLMNWRRSKGIPTHTFASFIFKTGSHILSSLSSILSAYIPKICNMAFNNQLENHSPSSVCTLNTWHGFTNTRIYITWLLCCWSDANKLVWLQIHILFRVNQNITMQLQWKRENRFSTTLVFLAYSQLYVVPL